MLCNRDSSEQHLSPVSPNSLVELGKNFKCSCYAQMKKSPFVKPPSVQMLSVCGSARVQVDDLCWRPFPFHTVKKFIFCNASYTLTFNTHGYVFYAVMVTLRVRCGQA